MPKTGDSFPTVWDGLGLGATQLALDATITPATLAQTRVGRSQPSEAQRYGLSLATLPLLSIELDPNAAAATAADVGGDITVTGVLGEGGMGRVLIARQRSLEREVAVKTVRDELLDASNVQNLISEGLITGYLEHPNITPVHQLGKDARGRPILVMKRITGVCWSELIADPEHAAWTQLVTLPAERQKAHIEILMQVCNGLSFAHNRGVVHRDIKSDNVMIGESGNRPRPSRSTCECARVSPRARHVSHTRKQLGADHGRPQSPRRAGERRPQVRAGAGHRSGVSLRLRTGDSPLG